MRQIILDTETTGLSPQAGHRVIEIGGVEMINRRLTGRHFHTYLQPDRKVDMGAFKVHGISDAFLKDKPRFKEVVDEFLTFIDGAELIIHNAPFDVGFINHELERLSHRLRRIEEKYTIIDTLEMARKKHPGQKNNLDALCKRYQIQNEHRVLHGALLDAEILADVYLMMTGGQNSFSFSDAGATMRHDAPTKDKTENTPAAGLENQHKTPVILASEQELAAHQAYMESL